MREKQKRIVVTFHTTAEAMATEKLCHSRALDGRLISAPRSLTADCGIAWSAPPALRDELTAVLREANVEYAGFYELEL